MENKTNEETARWVEERLALLAAPDDWEPDAIIASKRLQGRLSARRTIMSRSWVPRAAIVALACLVLIFAIPQTRALTHQLWQWLTVRKVEVVQADFQRLRGPWLVPQIRIQEAVEIEDAELGEPEELYLSEGTRRAGFTPRLPQEGVPNVEPELMTMDPMVWSTTLKVADLEQSLRQAGVDDQPIPKEWDGAQVSIHIGFSVSASWMGDGEMCLVQHPPITLSGPPDFDFAAYWTAALRAAGVDRKQAQELAERMTTSPTMILGIAADSKVAIRDVTLRSGPATLIEIRDESGRVERVNVIWSVSDRVYMLDAASEEQAIRAANSIE